MDGSSGLRIGMDLGAGLGRWGTDFSADRTDVNDGQRPQVSAVGGPLTGSWEHKGMWVAVAIGQVCEGSRHGVNWRGPAVLRRGWMNMALTFFYFPIRTI